MITLCNIVVKSLENHGIKCQTFHPHELGIIGTTSDFEIKQSNLDKLFENPENVSVTHGDVVEEKSPIMFGILSGDDIAVKIIYEAKGQIISE
jgi:isopentenyl phosphate kinase